MSAKTSDAERDMVTGMYENVKNKVCEKITEIFAGDSSGHDFNHSLRVYHNAVLISETEPCDKFIVMLAALLHDVDDSKLFAHENYENARAIMENCGIKKDVAEKVIGAISTVSFGDGRIIVPAAIEGKIVQDADRLDAMGAVGIARTFAFGGSRGRDMSQTLNHFYEKLFLLKDRMNTDSAKKIAEQRDAFMRQYVEEFLAECQGRK